MKFCIPTRILLPRKTKKDISFPLNVNTFANQHHRIKYNAKEIFYDYIDSLDLKQKFTKPVRIHYKYYAEQLRNFDESNIGGGLDKFLCDALVKSKILIDDNYKHVKHYTFEYMGIKKDYDWGRDDLKGYCEVIINTVD